MVGSLLQRSSLREKEKKRENSQKACIGTLSYGRSPPIYKHLIYRFFIKTGGVRPSSPPRHDTTAPEEPFCARGSIRLSLFLYYELFDPHVFKRVLVYFFSLLGFRVGSSLFGIPFVKLILLCEPYFFL